MLSDPHQLSQSHAPNDSVLNESAPASPLLTPQGYAIGRLLDEVRNERDLGTNERLVASAMCLDAMDNPWPADLQEIAELSQLSETAVLESVQKLVMAGFMEVVRDLTGRYACKSTIRYELRFPFDAIR